MNSTTENKNWAAAATLMTLSVSVRCARDFKYYRSGEQTVIDRDNLLKICSRLYHHGYSLQNLMTAPESPSVYPFLFLIGRNIHDDLETLHRDLLFFEPDDIVDIIPLIDDERKRWKSYNRVSYYSESLVEKLDHEFPVFIEKLDSELHKLPQAGYISN